MADISVEGIDLDDNAAWRLALIERLTVNKTLYQELDAAKLRDALLLDGTFRECYWWNASPELITSATDRSLDDPDAPLIVFPVHKSITEPCFAIRGNRWMSMSPGSKQFLRNSPEMMTGVRRLRGVMKIPTLIAPKGTVFYRAICSRYSGRGLHARSMTMDENGQLQDTSGMDIENRQLFIERHLQWNRRHPSPFLPVTWSKEKLLAVIEAIELPKKRVPKATEIQVISFDASGLELINPTAMFYNLHPNGIREEWTSKEWLKAFSIPEERELERIDILDTP